MKKPASKVAEPAQIQPKSQFLFQKNLPPGDFSLTTLSPSDIRKKLSHHFLLHFSIGIGSYDRQAKYQSVFMGLL